MLWKAIVSAAMVMGVRLDKTFDLKSLAQIVGNDGYPRALFMAVVIQLVADTDHLKDDCEYLASSRIHSYD